MTIWKGGYIQLPPSPYVRVKFKTFSLNDEVLKMNWELKNSIDDNSDELFVIEVFAQGMIIQWLEPKK